MATFHLGMPVAGPCCAWSLLCGMTSMVEYYKHNLHSWRGGGVSGWIQIPWFPPRQETGLEMHRRAAVYREGLYFLSKLRSFSVCNKMLQIFHQSAVTIIVFFAAVCRGSSIWTSDTNKLIREAGSVESLGYWEDAAQTVEHHSQ